MRDRNHNKIIYDSGKMFRIHNKRLWDYKLNLVGLLLKLTKTFSLLKNNKNSENILRLEYFGIEKENFGI